MRTFSSVPPKSAENVSEILGPLLHTAEDLRSHCRMAVWCVRLTAEGEWVATCVNDFDVRVDGAVRSIVARLGQTGVKPTYTLEDVTKGSKLAEFPLAETVPAKIVEWIGEAGRVLSELFGEACTAIRAVDVVTAHVIEHEHIALECALHRLWEVSQSNYVQELPGQEG